MLWFGGLPLPDVREGVCPIFCFGQRHFAGHAHPHIHSGRKQPSRVRQLHGQIHIAFGSWKALQDVDRFHGDSCDRHLRSSFRLLLPNLDQGQTSSIRGSPQAQRQ